MTVRELKEILAGFDPDLPCFVYMAEEDEDGVVEVGLCSDEEGEFVVITSDPNYWLVSAEDGA